MIDFKRIFNLELLVAGYQSPSGKPYLLYVGMRQPAYKNFMGLCRAFSSSAEMTRNFDLIAFGGGAFTSEEQQQLNKLAVSSNVYHVSGDDMMLAACYKGAAVFVYPSL